MKEQDRRRTGLTKADEASRIPANPNSKERSGTVQNSVFGLQRTVGNQAVASLFGSGAIQAKLRVSQPEDADELEADRIADQVVGTGTPSTVASSASDGIHRKCDCPGGIASCPACEEEEVEQAKGIHRKSNQPSQDELSVRDDFLQSLGPGRPLDTATQKSMESKLEHNFGDVRVHTDAKAVESARSINARAFTAGRDVVFASNEFSPHTPAGKKLLAHELAHVVQQAGSRHTPTLMREPGDDKPPVPKPGQTPFNFINESPALPNWEDSVKEMLEREFKKTFNSFQEAQEYFEQYLKGLPSDDAREVFADRMRDRARKAFYRREAAKPSYKYTSEDMTKLKNGAAPESGLQLEHMEDVKTKRRGGELIKGRPERALDPGNIYVTEGGPGGTAPRGTKHAEKYRTIEAAKKSSREIREKTAQNAVNEEPRTAGSAEPGLKTPTAETTTAPVKPTGSATAAEIIESEKAVAGLRSELTESVQLSQRLQLYSAAFGALLQALAILDTISDAMKMGTEGTVLGPSQHQAEQIESQAQEAVQSSISLAESMSLFGGIVEVEKARRTQNTDALFALSNSLGELSTSLYNSINTYNRLSRELDARARAILVMSNLYEKMVSLPMGLDDIPNAQAFTMFESLQKLHGPVNSAAQHYAEAATNLTVYADGFSGLASNASQAAWQIILARTAKAQAEKARETPTPPPSAPSHATLIPVTPPQEEKKSQPCPNCHRPNETVSEPSLIERFGSLGKGPGGQLTDEERKKMLEFLQAQ
jgi:hypothetical protein